MCGLWVLPLSLLMGPPRAALCIARLPGGSGGSSLPECLSSPLSPLGWPQWTTPCSLGRREMAPPRAPGHPTISSFGVAWPCRQRSQGPGLAPSCSGAEAGGSQASGGRCLRRSEWGLIVEQPLARYAAPSPGSSLVRSSTPVGKLRPAWALMNSHEGEGVGARFVVRCSELTGLRERASERMPTDSPPVLQCPRLLPR